MSSLFEWVVMGAVVTSTFVSFSLIVLNDPSELEHLAGAVYALAVPLWLIVLQLHRRRS